MVSFQQVISKSIFVSKIIYLAYHPGACKKSSRFLETFFERRIISGRETTENLSAAAINRGG